MGPKAFVAISQGTAGVGIFHHRPYVRKIREKNSQFIKVLV